MAVQYNLNRTINSLEPFSFLKALHPIPTIPNGYFLIQEKKHPRVLLTNVFIIRK